MGFKNDDSCLQKVAADEPIFVLRAQDILAPVLVRLWAQLAALHGASDLKCHEAAQWAQSMEYWATYHPTKFPD